MSYLNLSTLKVSEVFGPTFEGEGPTIGQLTWFLRMANCNQHCWWCDTAYTWAYTEQKAAQHRDGHQFEKDEEIQTLSVDEVCRRLLGLGLTEDGWLSISGGEPMLQQRGLVRLLPTLREVVPDLRVKVETAGTIPIDVTFSTMVDAFVVSPKMEHSGNEKSLRYRPDVLKEHLGTATPPSSSSSRMQTTSRRSPKSRPRLASPAVASGSCPKAST